MSRFFVVLFLFITFGGEGGDKCVEEQHCFVFLKMLCKIICIFKFFCFCYLKSVFVNLSYQIFPKAHGSRAIDRFI